MTDQQPNGSGTAPEGTVSTPSLSGDFPALLAQYEAQLKAAREEATTWERRYKGQQTALQEKATLAQQREAEAEKLRAELEGFKGTYDALSLDSAQKIAAAQKLADERAAKLGEYELRDTTRSLISKDFAALLPDFDNDPVVQAGVLALAKSSDPEALKGALAASLAAKQSGQTAAVQATLRGASPSAPASSTPATATLADLQKQLRDPKIKVGTAEHESLMAQLAELASKEKK